MNRLNDHFVALPNIQYMEPTRLTVHAIMSPGARGSIGSLGLRMYVDNVSHEPLSTRMRSLCVLPAPTRSYSMSYIPRLLILLHCWSWELSDWPLLKR
jgi:hypothetical protein